MFRAHQLDRDSVDRTTAFVRDQMNETLCGTLRRCVPETAAERARPLLPRDVELRIIDAGMISATADWCGVSSTPHFLAMMDFERGSRRWNERQHTYIAFLHGSIKKTIRAKGEGTHCDEPARVAVETLVQKRIRQYRTAASGDSTNSAASGATSRDPASKGPPISSMLKLFSSERIDQMIATVRDNLHRLTLPDGSAMARESDAERAQPLLPASIERRAVDAGMVSGVSEWCGVDPHLHYAAMMAWERGHRRWSAKQLAYIGGLHDAAKSAIKGSRQHQMCDPNGKGAIADSLMTRVRQYREATPSG
ncbi:MAG: hypothetical protein JO055_03725 [Alphaproteobacteria bacterium]|nr:hypothetical protein [Alphaproteobacteria bacterium]